MILDSIICMPQYTVQMGSIIGSRGVVEVAEANDALCEVPAVNGDTALRPPLPCSPTTVTANISGDNVTAKTDKLCISIALAGAVSQRARRVITRVDLICDTPARRLITIAHGNTQRIVHLTLECYTKTHTSYEAVVCGSDQVPIEYVYGKPVVISWECGPVDMTARLCNDFILGVRFAIIPM